MKFKNKAFLFFFFSYLTFVLSLSSSVFSADSTDSTNSADTSSGAKHVIVIGIDGLGSYGLKKDDLPHFKTMMENGAFTLRARAVLPTVSSPNWMSIISGAMPHQHGVTSNAWSPEEASFPPIQIGPGGIFPTIFSILKEQRPNSKAGVFHHWEGFADLLEKSMVHQMVHAPTEEQTMDLAIDYFMKEKPELLFIHLDHVDGAGHGYGHQTPQYHEAVKKADALVGKLLQATQSSNLADETVLLVISDHGGVGKGHGGESLQELEIPFILYGSGIKAGYPIQHAVYNFDMAATIAFILGLQPPYAWVGRPVKSALEGFTAPPLSNLPDYNKMTPEIIPAGGFFHQSSTEVTLSQSGDSNSQQGAIHYTLDGSIPTRESQIYKIPLTLTQDAVVMARIFRESQGGPWVRSSFRLLTSQKDAPVTFQYYEEDGLHQLPPLKNKIPKITGRSFELNLSQIPHRGLDFVVRFESTLEIKKSGTFTFFLKSDDGSALSIDDRMIVKHDGEHGSTEKDGDIFLQAGRHRLLVDYFQHEGGADLQVLIKGPQLPKQVLSPSMLDQVELSF